MVIKGSEILEVLHQIPEVRASYVKKGFSTLSSLLENGYTIFKGDGSQNKTEELSAIGSPFLLKIQYS
jgi:hypothetical protein